MAYPPHPTALGDTYAGTAEDLKKVYEQLATIERRLAAIHPLPTAEDRSGNRSTAAVATSVAAATSAAATRHDAFNARRRLDAALEPPTGAGAPTGTHQPSAHGASADGRGHAHEHAHGHGTHGDHPPAPPTHHALPPSVTRGKSPLVTRGMPSGDTWQVRMREERRRGSIGP